MLENYEKNVHQCFFHKQYCILTIEKLESENFQQFSIKNIIVINIDFQNRCGLM